MDLASPLSRLRFRSGDIAPKSGRASALAANARRPKSGVALFISVMPDCQASAAAPNRENRDEN